MVSALENPFLRRCTIKKSPYNVRCRPWRVSEWLAASLEMRCPERGCGFESRALRFGCVSIGPHRSVSWLKVGRKAALHEKPPEGGRASRSEEPFRLRTPRSYAAYTFFDVGQSCCRNDRGRRAYQGGCRPGIYWRLLRFPEADFREARPRKTTPHGG